MNVDVVIGYELLAYLGDTIRAAGVRFGRENRGCAKSFANFQNLVIWGGNDHLIAHPALHCGLVHPLDHGFPEKIDEGLSWKPRCGHAGWNHQTTFHASQNLPRRVYVLITMLARVGSFLALVCLTTVCFAQTLVEDVDLSLDLFLEDFPAMGMSVAIMEKGEFKYEATRGYSDAAKKTPVTRETVFEMGSAVSLLHHLTLQKLSGSGRISLQRPLSFLEPFEVTPQELMEGRYHFPDEMVLEQAEDRRTVPHLLEVLQEASLDRAPNQPGVAYLDQFFLREAIDLSSAQTTDELIKELILDPAGMSQTLPGKKQRVPGFIEEELIRPDERATGWLESLAGYTYTTTLGDLQKLDKALRQGRLLSSEKLKTFYKFALPKEQKEGPKVEFAKNPLFEIRVEGEETWFGWHGSAQGAGCLYLRNPKSDLSVIVLTNEDDYPLWDLASEIIVAYEAAVESGQ